MRYLFLLPLFLSLFSYTAHAVEMPQDTIWKKKKNGERFYVVYNGEIDPPPRRKAIPCFEIGINTFVGDVPADYSLRLISSRYVSIGYHQRFRVGGEESKWAIQAGLEGSWNNFRFDSDKFLTSAEEQHIFLDNSFELKRNKLTTVQLSVPLMAHYQFRKDNDDTWQVGVGVYGSYVLTGYTKVMFDDANGDTQKSKSFEDFYLTPFRVGATALVGFKQVNLFVKYDFSQLFDASQTPNLQVLTIGVRLQP